VGKNARGRRVKPQREDFTENPAKVAQKRGHPPGGDKVRAFIIIMTEAQPQGKTNHCGSRSETVRRGTHPVGQHLAGISTRTTTATKVAAKKIGPHQQNATHLGKPENSQGDRTVLKVCTWYAGGGRGHATRWDGGYVKGCLVNGTKAT